MDPTHRYTANHQEEAVLYRLAKHADQTDNWFAAAILETLRDRCEAELHILNHEEPHGS